MHTLDHNKMILCLGAAHASIFNKLRQAFFIKLAHEAFCHSQVFASKHFWQLNPNGIPASAIIDKNCENQPS